jgi:hypothetical protein
LQGNLTKIVLFLCEKHWNAALKTLESGVFYTTLYRSVLDHEGEFGAKLAVPSVDSMFHFTRRFIVGKPIPEAIPDIPARA